MNRILSSVPRRTLLVGGALVLALTLLTGIRSTNFAAAIGWYSAPACDDLEAQNPGDPNGCLFDARENRLEGNGGLAVCADGQDNDSDERTDCADPDCFGEDGCGSGEWCNVESAEFAGQEGECGGDDGVNKCSDELDNDSDGLINCADPDCAYGQGTWSTICLHEDPICAEYTCNAGGIGQDEASCGGNCADGDDATDHCADGQDNDGTGNGVDCADPSCANQAVCQNQIQTESDYASCGDGADNDADGQTDCDDPDCSYDQTGACWWAYTYINPVNWWDTYETDCGDGTDNDNDGYYDCADAADCSADYRCAVNTVSTVTEPSAWGYYNPDLCGNGYDDDADGSSDCEDGDCSGTAACAPRQCPVTEQDADGNCEADYPYWGPSCGDGYDNDGDGNGEDTNGNGQIDRGDAGVDCKDEDCRYDVACANGGGGGTVNEIQPDGYPVAWTWGNGYCIDGIDGDQNGWTDCWDDACDGQDPVCATFAGLGTEGWPYDYRYDGGDPRNGGNNHAGGSGVAVRCGDGSCDAYLGETCESCGEDCGDCINETSASASLLEVSHYQVSAADPEVAGSGDVYEFEIEFQVTAQGGDVYLDKTGMSWNPAPGSNGGTQTVGVTLDANGTTARDTQGVFTIQDGNTRTFTAKVALQATEDGWSGVQLTSLNWGTDSSGNGRKLTLSNFATDLQYMNYIYRN